MNTFFSIIVPVYNRPEEITEFLNSLLTQTYHDFEVIIVEDGSTEDCKAIAEQFADRLQLQYFYKENTGQGPSRNLGFSKAKGDFFLVFDSDVILPKTYLSTVDAELKIRKLDAFGGPDAAHPGFNSLQKATTYAMTSFFTTGGIRGGSKADEKFQPRSFNMGMSRKVYEATHGFHLDRLSEDIELSIRMRNLGFKVGLIPEAWVYHKRRTSLRQFFKQVFSFGHGRWILSGIHHGQLKAIHCFPSVFVLGLIFTFTSFLWSIPLGSFCLSVLLLWYFAILLDASQKNNSLTVGLLSMVTSTIQLSGYGLGFLRGGFRKLLGMKIY
ncbi:glycosyltransferase [Persicobacter psychrovividus]|uniref:Glycosyl transferase n=1 Tax=Persicobacter psychrovividus TaxID=387638 RepID=A0ABN6L5G0_9BACT|nr:glycosyl transferase [Persicobacter psychrovividus]